ncbi:hypothetical protein ZWY2020_009980 [Hordeum vulgare]|nr:hypothetical protein ZWY2020_009980 [Hordeum vulgare]
MDPNGSLTKDKGSFTSDEDYISYISHCMKRLEIYTMETHSEIQGSPLAIMDADLNSSGVFNISPFLQYPDWLVYGEQKPYTILGPSSYEQLCGVLPLVNQTPCTVPESTHGQMAMQKTMMDGLSVMFQQNPAPYAISTVARLRLDDYTCKQCNIRFSTSQAYGGHMSYHSKVNKKAYLDKSSYNGTPDTHKGRRTTQGTHQS